MCDDHRDWPIRRLNAACLRNDRKKSQCEIPVPDTAGEARLTPIDITERRSVGERQTFKSPWTDMTKTDSTPNAISSRIIGGVAPVFGLSILVWNRFPILFYKRTSTLVWSFRFLQWESPWKAFTLCRTDKTRTWFTLCVELLRLRGSQKRFISKTLKLITACDRCWPTKAFPGPHWPSRFPPWVGNSYSHSKLEECSVPDRLLLGL